jgi:hypothetical protein
MPDSSKVKEQKKESYLRNRSAILEKRRNKYREDKNNAGVGDVFTTIGVPETKIINNTGYNLYEQWREGIKKSDYLESVTDKSKTNTAQGGIYNSKYHEDQQRNSSSINAKILRPPPETTINKPTPRPLVKAEDIPEWKKDGNLHTFASNTDYTGAYFGGFF